MDSDKNTEGPTPVISPSPESTSGRKRSIRALTSTRKGKFLALIILILGVAVIGGWVYYHNHSAPRRTGPAVTVNSEDSALKKEVQDLQVDEPASTATPEEKIKYYDKLFYAQVNSEDYEGAAATFEQRKTISTDSLQYTDYFMAGQAYCKLKDSKHARESFDKVRATMPAEDDLSAGFSRENMLSALETIGKECGL